MIRRLFSTHDAAIMVQPYRPSSCLTWANFWGLASRPSAITTRNASNPGSVKKSRGMRELASSRIKPRSRRLLPAGGNFGLSCLRSPAPRFQLEALRHTRKSREEHIELTPDVVALGGREGRGRFQCAAHAAAKPVSRRLDACCP
jgi:hypothetical protein